MRERHRSLEAMLFSAGGTTRLGKVEEGNTLSDYHPDEIERQISINTSLLFREWKSHKINILDTPGYTDFTGEVKSSLRVCDTAVMLLKAVEGAEVGTEIVYEVRDGIQYRCVYLVIKLDQENADFENVVHQAREKHQPRYRTGPVPAQAGLGFDSIVDVLRMKVLKFAAGRERQVHRVGYPGRSRRQGGRKCAGTVARAGCGDGGEPARQVPGTGGALGR